MEFKNPIGIHPETGYWMNQLRELDQIIPVGPAQWLVPSRSDPLWHLVGWKDAVPGSYITYRKGVPARWTCTCPTGRFVSVSDPDSGDHCAHIRRVQEEVSIG